MEQSVAGQDVGVGLDTPLGIDNAGDIVELAKEVEAVEHPCEAAFEHGVRQAGIPDEVVGVHAAAFVAATAEHGEIGGQLEVPRQLEGGDGSIIEVEGIDAVEVGAVAVGVVPCEVSFQSDGRGTANLIAQAEVFAEVGGVDSTLHGGEIATRRTLADEVDAVSVFGTGVGGERQAALLVDRRLVTYGGSGHPVAVHVVGAVGAYAYCGIVAVAHGEGVCSAAILQP